MVERFLDGSTTNFGKIPYVGFRAVPATGRFADQDSEMEGLHGERKLQLWSRTKLPLRTFALRQGSSGQGKGSRGNEGAIKRSEAFNGGKRPNSPYAERIHSEGI